ncbi:hypothetical protein ACPCYX_13675 [Pseudomonas fluorescens]|uniref:hypothetical protein n=1 Tax=Pseudomonas fluorescens TaxID=294 RepID=UPI003C1CE353
MSTLIKTGVCLQKIETSEDKQVVVKLIRADEHPNKTIEQFADILASAPSVTLHIKDDGKTSKLDFDPWSDINVTPDHSIDENDIAAITNIALAFYHQQMIAPEGIGYLYRLPAEPPRLRVGVELFHIDEVDHQLYSLGGVYEAKSADSGSPFEDSESHLETGQEFDVAAALNELLKAFIKLKL